MILIANFKKNSSLNRLLFQAIFLITLFAIGGCNDENTTQTIAYQKKFSKAYARYKHPKDSLKLKALNFLLNNLEDQYYLGGDFYEKYKSVIEKSNKLSTIQLRRIADSLHLISKVKVIKDADVITSDFLIQSIDESFKVWEYPWTKNLTFSDFCEYILPYKSNNEEPQVWRKYITDKYSPMLQKYRNSNNPIQPINTINDYLSKSYKVSLTFSTATDVGFQMAERIGTGSCENACKMALYPMKAFGLPVALDYVPHWANRSSNHFWNVLVKDGKKYTFNATEAPIGSHKIEFVGVGRMQFKIAKVFRRTFSIQQNSINYLNNEEEQIPKEFRNSRIRDVTKQYVPTSDLSITTNYKLKNRFGYICVFNDKDWVPIDWTEIQNSSKLLFKDVGRDVAYLPIVYSEKQSFAVASPFILTKNGEVKALIPNLNSLITLKLLKKYPEDETNNIQPGDYYELLYWNNGWNSLGKQKANSTNLIFKHCPSNALFLLRDLTAGKQERIFTYENEKQIWW